jgi:hypothetical protein
MPTDNPERMIIPLSTRLLERIDDYRFGERHPTRASAVRELLDKALAAAGIPAKRRSAPKRPPADAEPEAAE